MAITFVAASSAGLADASGFTTYQVPKPAGVQQGDLLLAYAYSFGASGTSPAAGNGWATVQTQSGAINTSHHQGVFYKVAGGSEPASYDFNVFSAGVDSKVAIVAYRGATEVNASAVGATNIGGSTIHRAPSVVTSAADCQIVRFVGTSVSNASWAPPAGHSERHDAGITNSTASSSADQAQPAAGASGTADFICSVSPQQALTATVALVGNAAPNAPILTAPADGSTIDRNSTQRFDWDFSDPDAGDSQSKYDLRYRVVGAGTWTDITGTTPNTFHDFAAGTFAAGDYEWQARTYDAQGVVGPYSGSSFFTAATAPTTPTITAPINGATVSQNETTEWSAPDQDAYQHRRVADNAGAPDTGTIYEDSGEVVSITARARAVTFATNNRFEHVQVRIKDNGLWSAWASVRVQVSWTPPPTPLVSLLADDDAGSLVVTVTNPAPGAGEPAVSYNDIFIDDGAGEFRAATMVTPNTSWTYRLPVSGRDYSGSVRVVAVADNGITASS